MKYFTTGFYHLSSWLFCFFLFVLLYWIECLWHVIDILFVISGSKEGYAGVALYSKKKPLSVTFGLGVPEHDQDGRVITAEYDEFYLINCYTPNSGRGLVTLPKRLLWNKEFLKYLQKLDGKKPLILTGDLNVSHQEIDLARPKSNTRSAGFTQEERDDFTELLSKGFIDTFRELYPDKEGAYSYWTYMGNARAKNVGWRLDYFVISERLRPNLCDNVMRSEVLGSDHCPVVLTMHMWTICGDNRKERYSNHVGGMLLWAFSEVVRKWLLSHIDYNAYYVCELRSYVELLQKNYFFVQ